MHEFGDSHEKWLSAIIIYHIHSLNTLNSEAIQSLSQDERRKCLPSSFL